MKFLGELTKVTENKYRIGLIHNMPFDSINGIKHTDGTLMSQLELEQIGILVNDIPEPQIPAGKQIEGIYVNPATKEVWYEYKDKELTPEERITQLEQQNVDMAIAIANLLGM